MNIFTQGPKKISPFKASFNIILLAIILVSIFWFALSRVGIVFDFSFMYQYRVRMIDGFLMTLYISLASLVLSLLIGILSAFLHSSKILILQYLAKLYVSVIRGTPLIVQIYLFFYIVGTAFGLEDRFLSGVIILSVFEGAYISEIIRGSLSSIDKTQLDSAKAVGFTNSQTLRYIILPQLITRTLPALSGQFASIIKDSSLLSIISLIELTQTVREITSINHRLFEAYFILGLLYLALTLPINLFSKWMERKFVYEN